MKFNSKKEAELELYKYLHWDRVIYDGNGKVIKIVFVGTNDPNLSSLICHGLIGNSPAMPFNDNDERNADLWVGFHDCDIMRVDDMLKDDFMKGLLEPNGLRHEIIITQEWSKPIRIPSGLRITFHNTEDAQVEFKIVNADNQTIGYEKSFKKQNGGFYSISPYDQKAFDLEPQIRYITVRMPDAHLESKDITIFFEKP